MTNYLKITRSLTSSRFLVTTVEVLLVIAFLLQLVLQAKAIAWNQNIAAPTRPNLSHQPSSHQRERSEPSSLTSFHLFGKEETGGTTQPTSVHAQKAPESRLKVKIAGLLAHTEAEESLVILEHQGQQKVHRVGETIQNTQARILDIQSDRILIQHQGQEEAIHLYPPSKAHSNQIPPPSQSVQKSSVGTPDTPLSLADIIALSSVQKGQKIIGYRPTPKKFAERFVDAGLRNNDLVVAIDGYNLTNPEEAEEVIDELEFSEEATFTVNREGQLHHLELSL